MSDTPKREPRTWLVLVPEGDSVQFCRSPLADDKLIISDLNSLKASFEKAIHAPLFGCPVYKAEIGPVKLLDDLIYHPTRPKMIDVSGA